MEERSTFSASCAKFKSQKKKKAPLNILVDTEGCTSSTPVRYLNLYLGIIYKAFLPAIAYNLYSLSNGVHSRKLSENPVIRLFSSYSVCRKVPSLRRCGAIHNGEREYKASLLTNRPSASTNTVLRHGEERAIELRWIEDIHPKKERSTIGS